MKYKKMKLFLIIVVLITVMGCTDNSVDMNKLYTVDIQTKKINSKNKLQPAKPSKSVDVDQYIMDLALDTVAKRLDGEVEMKITNHSDDVLDKVCIRLYSSSVLDNHGESRIEQITIAESNENIAFDVKEDKSIIYANLSNHLIASGQEVTLKIKYYTDIPNRKDRFGYVEEKGKASYRLSFCFPSIAMYENGIWNENPFIDKSAETSFSKVSNYDITFHAPAEYMVIASGEETQKDNITRIKGNNMRDIAIVASNNMKLKTEEVKGVKINLYSLNYENLQDYNDFSMQATKDGISLFTDLFGKYPYKELDVIQMVGNTMMEYPGLIMVGYGEVGPNIDEVTWSYLPLCKGIVHEVAHQWFYATVGNDQYMEPWLDEGLSKYCDEVLYTQSGLKSFVEAQRKDEEEERGGSIIFASKKEFEDWQNTLIESLILDKKINLSYQNYQEANEYDYSNYVYKGGSLFFYEIRKAMGDENFFSMMQDYYETYYLKEASGMDMINAIIAYDDSEETQQILQRYLGWEGE